MLMDKIKNFFNKQQDGNDKKKIENLVVFIVILIITLIAVNLIWNGNKNEDKNSSNDTNKKLAISEENTLAPNSYNNVANNSQNDLSLQLEQILEKIEGVGKVKVLITYSKTDETIPMYNEENSQKDTEEKDNGRWNKKSN